MHVTTYLILPSADLRHCIVSLHGSKKTIVKNRHNKTVKPIHPQTSPQAFQQPRNAVSSIQTNILTSLLDHQGAGLMQGHCSPHDEDKHIDDHVSF